MTRLSPIPPQAQAPVVLREDVPAYRVIAEAGVYGSNDTLYPQGAMLYWKDEPNPSLEPLNDIAHKKMVEYLTKLDKFGREVAEKTGKHYTSLADSHTNAMALAQQESKQVELITGVKQVPLMGAKKKRGQVEEIVLNKDAPLMGSAKDSPILGDK